VSVSGTPATVGSVGGAGWYADGAPVSIHATPAAGFRLLGFSGSFTSTTNPLIFNASGPANLIGAFGPNGVPQLYAAPGAAPADGAPLPGQPVVRLVPLSLKNVGPGGALNAQIDSITAIQVVSGSGAVTPLLSSPALAGNLAVGALGNVTVAFGWPQSATRVRITVNFSANGGAYHGSTVLNLFR
jgi:hypothetical protein